MYISTIPKIIRKFYPKSALWEVKTNKKEVFLTFDDGPIPEVTPLVLNLLNKYKATATFFMVGENAAKYPILVKKVLAEGHAIGNHSFNHIKGWKTADNEYYANIEKASRFINSNLFRPPYGQLKLKQAKFLDKTYKIVMWTVLSGDYDKKTSAIRCFKRVKNHSKNGSIIVFHDSLKAQKNMLFALEESLKYFISEGYSFGKLV